MATDASDDPMVPVRDYATEADARHVASLLVENGVGATIEPVRSDEVDSDLGAGGFRVMVLSHQHVRAEETLGLREPSHVEPEDPDEPMKLDKGKAPWKTFALIWVAAMITVPTAAFLLTYYFMSR